MYEITKGISYPKCFALVSGGKDSLSTAQVLHEAGKLAGCVALRTNLSTPDWEDFVRATCDARGWPLEIYETDGSFEKFVMTYGFPGPAKHSWIMRVLKGRCIRKFRKQHPDGILASGVRSDESVIRAGSTKPVGQWEDAPILAPIYDWTTEDTWKFFYDRGFERAPGYSTMQISGDCMCGSKARKDEWPALQFHYPKLAKYLTDLGDEIKDAHPTRCKWGWGCDRPSKRRQTAAEGFLCAECGQRDFANETAPAGVMACQ